MSHRSFYVDNEFHFFLSKFYSMAHNILFQDSIYRCSLENSWFYTPCKVNGFVDKIFKSGCSESKVMHVFYWEILLDCPYRTLKNGRWKFPFPHTNTSSFQTSYFLLMNKTCVSLWPQCIVACLPHDGVCFFFFSDLFLLWILCFKVYLLSSWF